MEYNNNKSNKHQYVDLDAVCKASDFMHNRPSSTHNNKIKISQNNKEDHELIMGKQRQKFETSNEHRRPTATQVQKHQQPLIYSIDQATLAGLPKRTQSPLDDVEGRVGIFAHGPSYHDQEFPWKSPEVG